MKQIVVLQERCTVHTGELRSLIRMHQNLLLWLSPPDSHQQRLQHDIRSLTALHRPTDNTAGIEIDHHRDIGETFVGSDIGYVGDPGLVRGRDVELPSQRVVGDNGRPAAVNSRTVLVADLSLYPGNPRQTRDPVGAGCLAVIEQVVMKLAIPLNIAACPDRHACSWASEAKHRNRWDGCRTGGTSFAPKTAVDALQRTRTSLCIPGERCGRFF
jgi:hypothetical protein